MSPTKEAQPAQKDASQVRQKSVALLHNLLIDTARRPRRIEPPEPLGLVVGPATEPSAAAD